MRRHFFDSIGGTDCIVDNDYYRGVYAPKWEYADDEPAPTAASPKFTEAQINAIGDEVIARLADARAKGKSLVFSDLLNEPSAPPAPVRRAVATAPPPVSSAAASPTTTAPAPGVKLLPKRRPGSQTWGINHDGRGGNVTITKIHSR